MTTELDVAEWAAARNSGSHDNSPTTTVDHTADLRRVLSELVALHDTANTTPAASLLANLPLVRVEAAWREAKRVIGQ